MNTLDRQSARAEIDGIRSDVENVELTLDRTWSPYVQGTVTVAGLLVDLDPDVEPDPRFTLRLAQRFAKGLTGDEIAALFTGDTGDEIASGPWDGLTGDQIAALYESPLNPEPIAPRSLFADLLIREVELDLVEKRTTLTVASDDAKLWDARHVSTTPEPFSTSSVRAIVESVIARVGAVLVDGTADGDLDDPPILQPGTRYRDFLVPLLQQAGLRLYADERRRWQLVDVEDTEPGTVELSTARDVSGARPRIDRERGGYDSLVIEYRWLEAGEQMVAYDVAGPTRPRKTEHIVYDGTPYPGPGAAARVLDRLRRRRREIPVDVAANYSTRPTMSVNLSTVSIGRQSGRVARVTFQYPARMMTADLYDLEEISPESVRSIPSGIATEDLPGTTEDLIVGEL